MSSAPASLQTTLIVLKKDNQILLGKKMRGHGAGKWNGTGGKCFPGEAPEIAAVREAKEELGITARDLRLVATLSFVQEPYVDEYSTITTYVYLCETWDGEPTAGDELSELTWFAADDIPYDAMWQDDAYWLPRVLGGENVSGVFRFDSDYQLVSHDVTTDSTEQN